MLVHIENVLTPEEVAHCRQRLERADWVDGRVTAGDQSAKVKQNLQVPEDSAAGRELGEIVLRALRRSPLFTSAVLPLRIYPPMFNRYDVGMTFDTHVDNAIRALPGGARMRTDVSSTLFLTPPEDYDGGELVVEDTYGAQSVKLPAGDMVIYPSTSLHRVNPVTRGSRWASFFWTQSMIDDDRQRRLLFEMDMSIIQMRMSVPDDHPSVLGLTGCYHNLMRMWCKT
ncbi:Fe2+-dependent dioxygenase [Falsiroseomonas tokyonensis]|uniref:Fe2+-dependent dioxygenase n=1 Tax=Falsiroseomonas tokyonensis TaxID=430521 RepID=A0ABV7C145_9PROT|nr:Fe2+-dependent dioxygenase [Falsiroseomonas tokyonensis]MBU8540390.1 Fe2+-dependent dioxygenase [Falsiroseomonas tokyonensis]